MEQPADMACSSPSSPRRPRPRPQRWRAVAALALLAVLGFAIRSAHAQTVRALPTCLDAATTRPFGWTNQIIPPGVQSVQQPPPLVKLEYNAWGSANLTGYIAAILLREVMGVNVSLLEYSSSSGTFPRLASGNVSANVELWAANKVALYNTYVTQQGTVEDRYAAKTSLFINTAVADANPGLIFDSWHSYQQQSPVLANLLPVGTTPPARNADGSYICNPAKYSFCSTEGTFIPPQCQGANRASCRELWHISPSYSSGQTEQLIISLNLKLVVVYLGSSFTAKVTECARQGNYGCIFYYWVPEVIPATNNLTAVNLPPYSSTCYAKFNATNAGGAGQSLTCDWGAELLMKVGSATMHTTAPYVSAFMRLLKLRDVDINGLLLQFASNSQADVPACDWIRNNKNLWTSWIPAPPTDYIRYLDELQVSEGVTVAVLILTALVLFSVPAFLGLLYYYRKQPAVRSQSPPFMGLITMGVGIVGISVALEVTTPSASTCAARTWLLALGAAVVLSSIIVKTWRIFTIFGNRQMQRMKLGNTKLMMYVGALVLLDIVVLAVYNGVALPQPTMAQVTLTTYTYVCGTPATDGAMAMTAILGVYHALLLVAAVWLSFKIRKVASTYNESKFIGMASYQILVACAIVIPVVFLPINFRAQFVIKSIIILLACFGVLGLLVARPVIEAMTTSTSAPASSMIQSGIGAKSHNNNGTVPRTAPVKPPAVGNTTTATVTGSMARTGVGSSGDMAATSNVRYGLQFSMQKAAGLVRRWSEVHMVLIMGAHPTLQVSHPEAIRGTVHTAAVTARALSPDDASKLPGCFILTLQTTTWFVQTKDAAEAEAWVADITAAFAAVNATVSGGRRARSARNSTAGQSRQSVDGKTAASTAAGSKQAGGTSPSPTKSVRSASMTE
ncbi:hypothetical protein H9P43_006426 [Blastocladiella emersonii ATCC 22665]|nr:hypothetical protein H9P43_006426 [Blastocladiella emersonii ATCC 22665]